MAAIRTGAGTFRVPDGVVPDYVDEAPALAARDVDASWTVAQLRARARDVGVTYKGLSKSDLLRALA